MSRILKFIRGAAGIGLAFAVGLSGLFTVISVIKWMNGADLVYELIETVLTGAAPLGFLMGVVFSAVLAVGGRGRTLAEISLGRFVSWGTVGGLLFWTLSGGPFSVADLPEAAAELGISALLGALFAAGVHKVAGLGSDSNQLGPGERPDLQIEDSTGRRANRDHRGGVG
jgi:hypothetical protein